MVRNLSALWTGSFSVGLVGEDVDRAGGQLAFRVSQPLRVESGRADLRWVTGRTPGGRVMVEEAALDLDPSGRQIDLELWPGSPVRGRAERRILPRLPRAMSGTSAVNAKPRW